MLKFLKTNVWNCHDSELLSFWSPMKRESRPQGKFQPLEHFFKTHKKLSKNLFYTSKKTQEKVSKKSWKNIDAK